MKDDNGLVNLVIDFENPQDSTIVGELKLESLGGIISLETLRGGEYVHGLRVTIKPTQRTNDLFKVLSDHEKKIRMCDEYREILKQLELARSVENHHLGNLFENDYQLRSEIHSYMGEVYDFTKSEYGVSKKDLCSDLKPKKIVKIRTAIFYLLQTKFPKLGSVEIGRILKKNHATVLTSVKRIEDSSTGIDPDNLEKSFKSIIRRYKSAER